MISPNHGGALVAPTLIVMNNTGARAFAAAREWYLNRKSSASTHFLIDRMGFTESIVPTNLVAWHAGRSEYEGRTGVNAFSLSITLVNVGPVQSDYTAVATGEPLVEEDIVTSFHRLSDCQFTLWQSYPDAQIQACARLIRQLAKQHPSLVEVVDHSDVAGFRHQWACGPALPLRHLQLTLLESRSADINEAMSSL